MTIGTLLATIALVGGTLWTGDGERIEGATVLIEGNRIIQVGRKIPIPTGAVVRECHGRVITPAFVDAFTQLGLVEISGVGSSNDTRPKTEHPIRANLSAQDALNPNSSVLPHQVEYGVLNAGTHLSGGLVSGQLTAVNLTNGRPYPHFVGVNVIFGGEDKQSRAYNLARIREAFEQARRWIKTKTVSSKPDGLSEQQLSVLAKLIKGEGRLFVQASRQSDMEAALELGKSIKAPLTIVGAHEAWRIADRLSQANVSVVVNPVHNQPSNFDRLYTNPQGISVLLNNGVDVALSTFSTHQVRKLRQWAGNAIRDGMPYPDAIRAVTVIPSTLLGLSEHGGIKPGQIADLVVWDGDPFELSTMPTLRMSNGRTVTVRTRQKKIFDRYRCLPNAKAGCATNPKHQRSPIQTQ